ncbi:MAG: hypothetical protein R2911_18045 [Caldilineaceae bacterium]
MEGRLIRSLDDKNAVTAHGVVGALTRAAPGGADDWRRRRGGNLWLYLGLIAPRG